MLAVLLYRSQYKGQSTWCITQESPIDTITIAPLAFCWAFYLFLPCLGLLWLALPACISPHGSLCIPPSLRATEAFSYTKLAYFADNTAYRYSVTILESTSL